ncbi:unnamed protein product [Trichogramma brassicae]|uniref:Uncharacterized protein n=1 Tax=Trichogramma brassicae TaxID=86971 RepID=A0A6H5IIQ5_9HYME|nr:unnamed protein product [Trichogramma brassicae]
MFLESHKRRALHVRVTKCPEIVHYATGAADCVFGTSGRLRPERSEGCKDTSSRCTAAPVAYSIFHHKMREVQLYTLPHAAACGKSHFPHAVMKSRFYHSVREVFISRTL